MLRRDISPNDSTAIAGSAAVAPAVAPVVHRERRARLVAVGAYLPEMVRTSRQVEALVAEASDGYVPTAGIVETMTGIQQRHVAADDQQCSDLAVMAARDALDRAGMTTSDIDLLIFASAGQDLLEPATSAITACKLGLSAPTFDVKNACNSMLNAIEVASAFIAAGRYETVLVVTGEVPSRAIQWNVSGREDFRLSFPGYTFGDAGSAVLLTACDQGQGFVAGRFRTDPSHWDIGTLPGGGSMHPRGDEYSYFRCDGSRLGRVFDGLGTDVLNQALTVMHAPIDSWDVVLVHQVTVPMFNDFLNMTGVCRDKTVLLVDRIGNCASASMPLQLSCALQSGRAGPGSRVLWIGLAGGINVGVMGLQL